jgi:putative ABC transport system permease protein
MVVVPIQDTDTPVQQQLEGLKNEFLQNPHILAVTTSYDVMGMNVERSFMWTVLAEGDNGMQQHAFNIIWAGDNYLKTMGIQLINGRDFQSGPKADIGDAFIVNEAAAKLMGWTKDPIGKKINFVHSEKLGHVIGVVKDFNFASLHNPIDPLLIVRPDEEGGYIYLKIKGDLGETINFIKDKWPSFDPNHPFEYFFLDQRFNDQYKADEIQYKLLSGLSYICIFISLLGLLGLSAFTATQRTKEIGIRNVHGASIPSIIYLLYKEVMLLIITASVLIIPISYYIVSRWLTNFAYQTKLNYFMFVVVAVLALLIALLTVGFHSFKVARASPITSLKYE